MTAALTVENLSNTYNVEGQTMVVEEVNRFSSGNATILDIMIEGYNGLFRIPNFHLFTIEEVLHVINRDHTFLRKLGREGYEATMETTKNTKCNFNASGWSYSPRQNSLQHTSNFFCIRMHSNPEPSGVPTIWTQYPSTRNAGITVSAWFKSGKRNVLESVFHFFPLK